MEGGGKGGDRGQESEQSVAAPVVLGRVALVRRLEELY